MSVNNCGRKTGRITRLIVSASLMFTMIFSILSVNADDGANTLIPGGQSIGVSLDYDGVYVDDLGDVDSENNGLTSPAKQAGIRPGDIIKSVNDQNTTTVEDFNRILNSFDDGSNVRLIVKSPDNTEKTVSLSVVKDKNDDNTKIGIWAKDAASGVGTITFYDPSSNHFYAVGHEISDSKTGASIGNLCGDVYKCEIVGIRKGEKGTPGELIGVYSENKLKIGMVTDGSEYGIEGEVTRNENFMPGSDAMQEGEPSEVTEGEAFILSNVESDKIKKYKINIEKVDMESDSGKNIIFKVTDDELIQKTGGIVRGMSGSPIIQNDKIVGAVTHVLVNDPLMGYGVFIKNMQK